MSYKSAYSREVRVAVNAWMYANYHTDILLVVAKMAKEKLPTRAVRQAMSRGNDAYMEACTELVHQMCCDSFDLDIALRYAPGGQLIVPTTVTNPATAIALLSLQVRKDRQAFGKYIIHGIVRRLFRDYAYITYDSAGSDYVVERETTIDSQGRSRTTVLSINERHSSLDALSSSEDSSYDPTRSSEQDPLTATYYATHIDQDGIDLLEAVSTMPRKDALKSYAKRRGITAQDAAWKLEDVLAVADGAPAPAWR